MMTGMQVEYGFIAEAADAVEGLFYVVRGGTDIWHTPPEAEYPLVIGPMSFVIRLSGEPHELGESKPLAFKVVDADGRSTGAEGQGEIAFGPHPVDRTRTTGALIHFKMGVPVPGPGAYFFELFSGQERLIQIPFWILKIPAEA